MDQLTLMIIRHAEKPKKAWPGPGLTIEGEPDGKSLVIRGWQRAGAWSALFGAKLGGIDFPQPEAIYAANPNPSPGAVPADAAETNKDPANALSRRSRHWPPGLTWCRSPPGQSGRKEA
jgi:hypothetical protein